MSNAVKKHNSKKAAVTVVVPAYNHAQYVKQALDSVRAQTFNDWEMVVIDDGSTDDTWRVLQAYQEQVADPRIRLLTQNNAGAHATLNRGMSLADTPYLSILNSDDMYAPDRLETLLAIAKGREEDACFVTTAVELVDETGSLATPDHWWWSMYEQLKVRAAKADPIANGLLWGNFTVSTSNFFMSRSLWERVGEFRNLRYVHDWDYALRVAVGSPDAFVFLADKPLLQYRLHGANAILGGALRNHAEAAKVLRNVQKELARSGKSVTPDAIDRLHYITRFIRHEHARQLLEVQKLGWLEQVNALTLDRERISGEAQHWQGQSGHWEGQAHHWQEQSGYWKDQAHRWLSQSGHWEGQAQHWQCQSGHWEGQAHHWQEQSGYWKDQAHRWLGQSGHWEGQAQDWQGQSGHWEQQANNWKLESQHWQRQVDQIKGSISFRITSPFRYLGRKLRAAAARVRKAGRSFATLAMTAMSRSDGAYGYWLQKDESNLLDVRKELRQRFDSLSIQPMFSIVMPVHNTPLEYLSAAVESVRNQWYERWELCICDDGSDKADTRKYLKAISKADSRIKLVRREVSGHIVVATNQAILSAKGDYVAFLDHDDLLAPNALLSFAEALNRTPGAALLYSDEDKIDDAGVRSLPFFKPDWSPALAWSQNYVGHLMCVQKDALDRLGGLSVGTQGSQDHDLVLRIANQGGKIIHVPEVLYHWRMHSASTSVNASAKPYAHTAGKEVVAQHLRARYDTQFSHVEDSEYTFVYNPRFKLKETAVASIVIPTRDKADLLKACLNSIFKITTGVGYEIIILNNGSVEEETEAYLAMIAKDPRVNVVDADIPFNWSRLNNLGRVHSKGDVLVFLNNDTLVISPDWLVRMMEYALLPDVATVGPLLLYPDETIQHAGVVVGMGGWADHVFKGQQLVHYPSPFVSSMLPRNVLANTGACVAIATQRFDDLGGFDEAFEICGSDVELGIRAHKSGYQNVYLPTCRLYHLESKTRSAHVPEVDFQQSDLKYAPFRLGGDPFYNRNLDLFKSSPTPHSPVMQHPKLAAANANLGKV